MINIVMITKILCYHQVYIADELYKIYGESFKFVQMREPLDWRVKTGQEGFFRPYLLSNENDFQNVKLAIKKADVLLYGEMPLKYLKYAKKTCLIIKMSENIFKNSYDSISLYGKIKRYFSYKMLKILSNKRNMALFACSGFAYNDYAKFKLFKNTSFKWGYFPKLENYNRKEIIYKNDCTKLEIIWVSRIIKCKNPFFVIELAKRLKLDGYNNFHISVIGNSDESEEDLFSKMKNEIDTNNLHEHVSMLGKVSSNEVFEHYKKSNIALFTGDASEGWGVGVNEAMSCGCSVVVSNVVGSAPFMCTHSNSIVFDVSDVNEFINGVESLIKDKDLRCSIALNAFDTIEKTWNYKNAAKNFSLFVDNYFKNGFCALEDGPCSSASFVKYDWYKETN